MNLKEQANALTAGGVPVEASASEITLTVAEDLHPSVKRVLFVAFGLVLFAMAVILEENLFHLLKLDKILAAIFLLWFVPMGLIVCGYGYSRYRKARRPTVIVLDIPDKKMMVYRLRAVGKRERSGDVVTFEQLRAVKADGRGVWMAHVVGDLAFGSGLDDEQRESVARFVRDVAAAGLEMKKGTKAQAQKPGMEEPMHEYHYGTTTKSFVVQIVVFTLGSLAAFSGMSCKFTPNPNAPNEKPTIPPEAMPWVMMALGIASALAVVYLVWAWIKQSNRKDRLLLFDDRIEMVEEYSGERQVIPYRSITNLYWHRDQGDVINKNKEDIGLWFTITHGKGALKLISDKMPGAQADLKTVRAFVTVRYERDVEGVAPGEIEGP